MVEGGKEAIPAEELPNLTNPEPHTSTNPEKPALTQSQAIAKAVALKAAVEMHTKLESDTKKIYTQDVIDEILDSAKEFEAYLEGKVKQNDN